MQMPPSIEAQLQRMQQMHERLARARTPAERQTLMAEHQKLMQEGMAMMSGMKGTQPPAPGTPEAQRMMDMRMQMIGVHDADDDGPRGRDAATIRDSQGGTAGVECVLSHDTA